MNEYLDVVIVGAGLSGIGAAHHLQKNCPGKTYTVLEARETMGGTWDLFKYPGIRSDSDMYTLGYSFKPWTNAKAIADGPAILDYIQEAANDGDVNEKIKYNHKIIGASWDSTASRWTLEVEKVNEKSKVFIECNFLFMCSGYYDYDKGYTPEFAGLEDFQGRFVHPQKWTSDIEYEGKEVIIIGSGATAVTLVPAMAEKAKHVTMLQRTPTYISTVPGEDGFANFMKKWLPSKLAYWVTRWKKVLFGMFFFNLARTKPEWVKWMLRKGLEQEITNKDIDLDKHFKPPYNPWDQRLCAVPDSDLFKSLNDGSSSVVTDHIETFTKDGIKLKSGEELKADLIVSATGLNLKFMGGIYLKVDGEDKLPADLLTYRGMMYEDVPNLAQAFGYTNASWTLKSDLTCEYVCRLLKYMDKNKKNSVTPRVNEEMEREVSLDFNSSYVLRTIDQFPKQGSKSPWKLYNNYAKDIIGFEYSSLENKELEYR